MKYASAVLTVASLLFVSPYLQGDDTITPSPRLPASIPWDLQSLSQPPSFQWVDAKASVRSLLYAGQPYEGRPTQVFAYYASPGTLAGDESLDKNLPAIVRLDDMQRLRSFALGVFVRSLWSWFARPRARNGRK